METKHSVITSFLNRTKDRFHEYNELRDFEERLKLAATMEGISGIEVVFPYEISDPLRLKHLCREYNLGISAINVNVKAEPEFRNGSVTANDKDVRWKAIQFIKEAKDFAQASGADKVTCCPLADGYEFSFNSDYRRMWEFLVSSFKEAGSYKREIPLFIEYKPSETRGHCFLDTVAKTLLLLNDIGIQEMGITLDFGHSIYGGENPAEALCLVAGSGHPYYIHINDNDGKWDWDYMVATKHYIEYVEFLYYLQELNYKDYLTSDTSPTRWDIKETFEMNARMTEKLWQKLRLMDREELSGLIQGRNHLKTSRFLEQHLFGLI